VLVTPVLLCAVYYGFCAFEVIKMTYAEKLRDPRWQKKRLEILDDRGWACELCCNKDKTLHVHHVAYFHNKEPWQIDNDLLRVLCEDCHDIEHNGEELEVTIDYLNSYWGYTKQEIAQFLTEGFRRLG